MSFNLIYITGGAKSGKSKFAEDLLLSLNNGKQKNIYLATSIVYDEEMQLKVELHKKRREDKWITIEAYKNLLENLKSVFVEVNSQQSDVLKNKILRLDILEEKKSKNNMLVDCLTNMVSNIIFEKENIDWDNITKENMIEMDKMVEKEVEELLEVCKEFDNIVIVSNELGMGIVPSYPLGRYFREIAGKMNQYIADKANEVYFVVSGIPMKIKG